MTTQYEGGYFMLPEPLVRGYGAHAHTAKDTTKLSYYTVESVNLIQNTAWSVNTFILDLIKDFQTDGLNIEVGDDMLLRLEKPEKPEHGRLPDAVWRNMDKEARKQVKLERARELEKFDEDNGVWMATERVIAVAEEMAHYEKFYFPHNLDFRLRIYPIPSDLNPQSSDLSKGMLKFQQGTRLGADGVYWLAFNVASHWGEDRLHPDDRVRFVMGADLIEGHALAEMVAWVDNPYVNRGWMEADKPFQFLAAAYEWVWSQRLGNPESYVSYLPGSLDGSCNGAQHLSILMRDEVGAIATNCSSSPVRHDLYMEVADRVWEVVQRQAAEGNAEALHWVPKMKEAAKRRKVVKRAVMTTPYGVSHYGVAKFMVSDKFVEKHEWAEAKYMRDRIIEAINSTLAKGRELQEYFSLCAGLVAQAKKPLQWDTPAGSKVTQAYRNLVASRVKTLNTKFYVYAEDNDAMGYDLGKSQTAAPPNVIHSCDAAHLQMTVVRMAQAGIRNFSMVHDSFGCPMAQVGLMRDILRQTAVDMYQDDYLAIWKASVEHYTGVSLPEPPPKGSFDLNEILRSEYFFS